LNLLFEKNERPRFERGLSFTLLFKCLLCFCIFQQNINARDFLLIHEKVGTTLDLEEKVHYRLFPEIYNFIDAQFFEVSPETIAIQIRTWSEAGEVISLRYIKPYDFYCLRAVIEQQPTLSEEERQNIRKRFQPLFTDRFLAEVPPEAYCRVRTLDKRKFAGIFYRVKDNYLQLWIDKKVVSINKNNLAKIKYWSDYRQQEWPVYFSLFTGGIIAYSAAAYLTGALNLLPADAYLFKLGSAALGVVAGYQAAPIINEWTLPSVTIEFRKNRIKRLDTIHKTFYTLRKMKDRTWQK